MFSLIRAVSFASLAVLPVAAGAQTGVPSPDDPGQPASLAAATREVTSRGMMDLTVAPLARATARLDGPRLTVPQNQGIGQPRRRDSLWNGVLIGAGLGAIAGALAGDAIVDCNECAGFNVPVTFGVLGAGIGASIGASIDALHHDHSTMTGVPTRTRRVSLFPLLGRRVQALAASVRF